MPGRVYGCLGGRRFRFQFHRLISILLLCSLSCVVVVGLAVRGGGQLRLGVGLVVIVSGGGAAPLARGC